MIDLTTTAAVLAWAAKAVCRRADTDCGPAFVQADTATAARVAKAVRLLAAWEYVESDVGYDYEYAPCLFDDLRAAIKGDAA